MDIFASRSQIQCSINASVNLLSVSTMPQHYQYWTDYAVRHQRTLGKDFLFGNNTVTNPKSMSITILPKSYIDYIEKSREILNKSFSDNSYTQTLNRRFDILANNIGIDRNEKNLQNAKQFYTQQGLLKGIDYFKVFPELGSIL